MAFETKPIQGEPDVNSNVGKQPEEFNLSEKSAPHALAAKKATVSKKSVRKTVKGFKAFLDKVYVFIKKFIFDICFLLFMFSQEIDDTSFLK